MFKLFFIHVKSNAFLSKSPPYPNQTYHHQIISSSYKKLLQICLNQRQNISQICQSINKLTEKDNKTQTFDNPNIIQKRNQWKLTPSQQRLEFHSEKALPDHKEHQSQPALMPQNIAPRMKFIAKFLQTRAQKSKSRFPPNPRKQKHNKNARIQSDNTDTHGLPSCISWRHAWQENKALSRNQQGKSMGNPIERRNSQWFARRVHRTMVSGNPRARVSLFVGISTWTRSSFSHGFIYIYIYNPLKTNIILK